jgi:hypothetical protein
MKKIYLRIEHCKKGKLSHEEIAEATMDKNFVYYDKYKIKKVDTEKVKDKDDSIHRRIKVNEDYKRNDSRFILR